MLPPDEAISAASKRRTAVLGKYSPGGVFSLHLGLE